MPAPTFQESMSLIDQVLATVHSAPANDPPSASATPATDEEILRQLGVLGQAPTSTVPQVSTAPAVSPRPAVAAPTTPGSTAGMTVDDAVGNPGVALPAAAVWASEFPVRLYKAQGAIATRASQAIIGGDGYTTPALGSVLVAGTVAADGTATSLSLSTNGDRSFATFAGSYAVQPGEGFTFGQVVDANAQINVATTAASTLSDLLVVFVPGLVVNQTTASQTTINGDVTAKITGPVTVETAAGTSIDATVTGSVDATVTGTVDVSGPVTIETASGTPIDATITGAVTIDSGTVDATIQGTPTVNISTGQVVDVQNASGGSLTVAGTVDIGGTPNVTIDTTGGAVDVSATGTVDIGTVDSITAGSITVDNATGNPVHNDPVQGSSSASGLVGLTNSEQQAIPSGGLIKRILISIVNGATTNTTPSDIYVSVSIGPSGDTLVANIPAGDLGPLTSTQVATIDLTPGISNEDGIYVKQLGTFTGLTAILFVIQ